YKIGTYYNYCAASAGYYCYDSSSGTGDSAYDICPAGWKLPSGEGDTVSGSYAYLNKQIGNITMSPNSATDLLSLQTMLSTPVSGHYRSGTVYRQGTYGYFWSSTFNSTSDMYRMRVSGTAVSPQNNSSRGNGCSVRCIAQS
ncbi:MAG: FISUMP domain-containing protein, partial [Candidatus Saccharibacteria bacterium]|nr:FISUMP domain-containing protein [Candidatus Saccharibacteria bacterium]